MQEASHQPILSSITNIKVAGVATMSYWSILETNDSIYFVQTGSALGIAGSAGTLSTVVSVIGDMVASHNAKQVADKDLTTVLSEASQYFGFNKESLAQITTIKRLLGGKITFPNGKEKSWTESGIVKLKLSGKKYRLFLEMLQRKQA
ncbi:MAG: hypothetical protein V1848_02320 [Candidatus Magasanikbacteria bacterium]